MIATLTHRPIDSTQPLADWFEPVCEHGAWIVDCADCNALPEYRGAFSDYRLTNAR